MVLLKKLAWPKWRMQALVHTASKCLHYTTCGGELNPKRFKPAGVVRHRKCIKIRTVYKPDPLQPHEKISCPVRLHGQQTR